MLGRIARRVFGVREVEDEVLMGRVAERGDAEAFAELVRRWRPRVRRLCVRMLHGDEGWGEDLAQEVFSRVYEKRSSWRPVGKFSTWLWRVAVNVCTSEVRKRARRGDRVVEADDERAGGTEERTPLAAAAASEEAELVRRAVAALPDGQRAVLVLRHYEGLKRREIADVLEIPEGTVSSRLAGALEQLSRELAPILELGADGAGGAEGFLSEPRSELI